MAESMDSNPIVGPVSIPGNTTNGMIIILSAFGISASLAVAALWISYQAIAHNLNVNDAIQLMQVALPITTLVIGSTFGFIAGRQVKV